MPLPRLQAWYGDAGKTYSYSGIDLEPEAWIPELTELRDKISAVTGTAFNSVLINLYRGGRDSNGWHADDEPSLGLDPVIASISLGAERAFHLKHKREKDRRAKLVLAHGSLLVMGRGTQANWLHQVPKTTREIPPRINLTFRLIH